MNVMISCNNWTANKYTNYKEHPLNTQEIDRVHCHNIPSSVRFGVVGVALKKLVLMRANCPRRPDRQISKGLQKL